MDDNLVAEQRGEYKPRNFRIISLRTARRMLHVEDVLEIARIRVELWAYEKGSGASGHADAYLDVDTARVLAAFLAMGSLPEPVEEMGGGTVGGALVARIFRAEEAEGTQNPIRISVTNGPGTRQPNGLISLTRGAAVEKVQVLLSRMDARRLGLALAEHLQAWATNTYAARRAEGTWRPEPEAADAEPEPAEETGPGSEGEPAWHPRNEIEPAPRPAPDLAAGDHEPDRLPPVTHPAVRVQETGSPPAGRVAAEPGRSEAAAGQPLRYGNGATVRDNEAEIEAFRAYVAAEGDAPVSVDALRSWVMRTGKGRGR